MRELKFRAWDTRRMMYGVSPFTHTVNDEKDHLSDTGSKHDDCIFMQYTGLTDKNNTPIFEGDIVQVKPNSAIGIVAWDEDGYWGVLLNGAVYAFSGGTDIFPRTSKVIGNIYQNKELLA